MRQKDVFSKTFDIFKNRAQQDQQETLNGHPLLRAEGRQGGRRNPPNLFGIWTEIDVVHFLSEMVDDPGFEGISGRLFESHDDALLAEAQEASDGEIQRQAGHDFLEFQRIFEVSFQKSLAGLFLPGQELTFWSKVRN